MAAVAALALALPPASTVPTLLSLQPASLKIAAEVASSVISWAAAHKVQAAAGALLGIPLLAAIEAGYIVMKYRNQHGEAPHPIVPSHGTVTVLAGSSKDDIHGDRAFGLPTLDSSTKRPLRLLVIGDSLAAGVGTTTSCTPILPQSIATSLSRDLGGRPVQWTALGEPGASAGWIARTLESFKDSHGDGKGEGNGTGQDDKDEEAGMSWEGFLKQQLEPSDEEDDDAAAKQLHIDSKMDKFDVAVVLTGSNDLKFAVLPFMFRQQRKAESTAKGKGDFAAELRNAIEAVSRKMKVGIADSLDKVITSVEEGFDVVRNSVEEAMPEAVLDRITWSNFTDLDVRGGAVGQYIQELRKEGDTNATSAAANGDGEEKPQPASPTPPPQKYTDDDLKRPLVVLPALPAKVLPVSRAVPLRWIAFPLLGVITRAKQKLAKSYPGVVFVDAPEKYEFDEYRQRRGLIWKHKEAEGKVVSVTDVNAFECQHILQQMQEYNRDVNGPEPFLAPDGVHPSDFGYDYWGRSIAQSIIKEWLSVDCKQSTDDGSTGTISKLNEQEVLEQVN